MDAKLEAILSCDDLGKLERMLIQLLHQVWRMLGKRRKIIELD